MRKIEQVGAAVIIEITSLVGVSAWDNLAPETRARVKESLGRAAIEAMRVPTEGMVEALSVRHRRETQRREIGKDYTAMIDAALEEGEGR